LVNKLIGVNWIFIKEVELIKPYDHQGIIIDSNINLGIKFIDNFHNNIFSGFGVYWYNFPIDIEGIGIGGDKKLTLVDIGVGTGKNDSLSDEVLYINYYGWSFDFGDHF
jgi:hypothetical protein